MKWDAAEHHAIGISVQPITGVNTGALNPNAPTCMTLPGTHGGHGVQSQGADTEGQKIYFRKIANATIDHNARPTLTRCSSGQIATKEGPLQTTSAVHDQNTT